MGQSGYNTASRDEAIASTHRASLSEHGFTFAATTTPQVLIPIEGPYSDAVTNSSDFTVSAAAGTITANFTGKISCSAEGSFSLSANKEMTGHFFVNEVSQSKGFIRDITNFGNFGSFSAPGENISVTSGDEITMRLFIDATTATATLHDYAFKIQRFN